MAINNGMLTLANKIIDNGFENLIGHVNKEKNNAFILCITKQFWELANKILDSKYANAIQKNKFNDTTLLLSLSFGNLQLAKRIILETNVDLLQKNQYGNNALDISIACDYHEIVDLIRSKLIN
jgi:hypothetical protein